MSIAALRGETKTIKHSPSAALPSPILPRKTGVLLCEDTMKIAVIGSRGLTEVALEHYLSPDCTEIVSGGAKGIDTLAAAYAKEKGLSLTIFLPEYARYGRVAPIIRNHTIVDYADAVIALWDGASRGTRSVIDYCQKIGKPCTVITLSP